IQQLEELLIPVTPTEANPSPFVSLGDIASIELVGKVESVSRTNGQEAIAVQIVKGQDANTVAVVNEAKEIAEELESSVDGLIIEKTLDQGEPIEKSVETMLSKALFGAGFAIFIILIFLRDIKSTIISVISIPLSLLIAFTVLKQMDITLNMMTLGAMTVAIGRVIDDSIVVVENIYRRLHLKNEQLKGRALIRSATIEMFRPILASTLVTVAVFAPLVLVGGIVGELFMPFALTMTFALLASLLVAITVVPALSHSLFKKKLYGNKGHAKMR
ncbi:efflux RND transporter permease subunit, partial [Butyricicoccus sp. 1XD8-22]